VRDEVQISVSDRGRGIDAEDLAHIFEPFYRGRYALDRQIHGNGLGLSLVQRIARAFGATKTPEAFLFDKDGKLVYHGAIDDSQDQGKVEAPYLKNALDSVVAGKEVAVKETKSIGCGIKFRS